MDPVPLAIAFGPLALYLLLMGAINLGRRPRVISGARDAAMLAIALSGLLIVGLLFTAFVFQIEGLSLTTPSKSAFVMRFGVMNALCAEARISTGESSSDTSSARGGSCPGYGAYRSGTNSCVL